MDWRTYEVYITKHFRRLFPGSSISHDVKRQGLISKTTRQVDILIESQVVGHSLTTVVDCKYFNRKVDITCVDAFLSFVRDVRASKGIMITNRGYSDAAYNRATYDSHDVELRIIPYRDLDQFQDCWAIPYLGSHCALVSAPPGWIVDAAPSRRWLAAFYPAGFNRTEAYHKEGFIYLSLSKKDHNWPNLTYLLERQRSEITYGNPTVSYSPTVDREDCSTILRIIEAEEMRDTVEYSLFLDYPGVVLFLVLLTTKSEEHENVKRLEWIAQKLIKGNVLVDRHGNPMNIAM